MPFVSMKGPFDTVGLLLESGEKVVAGLDACVGARA